MNMSNSIVVELQRGIKFRLPGVIHSGDERYIFEKRLSGEEYTAHGFAIKPGDTIIDIGAHIGRFAVFAATESKTGRVYAFEPQPDTYERLKENVELNSLSNVVLSTNAVAGEYKKIQLHTHTDSARSSMYAPSRSSIEIECMPLADVFEKNSIQRCAFLKSDCEGAEFEIFFSLPEKYFARIDKIVLEFHDHLSNGKKMFDLFKLFTNEGYILRARWGAFYTGLLFAKKSSLPAGPLRSVLLNAYNYGAVYGVDFTQLCIKLLYKRFFQLVGLPVSAYSSKV
jgi:FkbM family methyltransferase